MQADRATIHAKSSGKLTISIQRAFMKLHIALYRFSHGAIGGRFGKRSFLLLTTIGRKSGLERVTPLFYIPQGENFVVIASNWGAASHATWWLNLQAHAQAKVESGSLTLVVMARTVSGEERSRLWSTITASYPNFADYQQHITREIPVVILTPTQAS